MLSSSYVYQERTDAYKYTIIYGFVASTYLHRKHLHVFYLSLPLLPICVHRHALLCNFGQWLSCTSVLDWDLNFTDYRLLQLHCDIHAEYNLRVILCFNFDFHSGICGDYEPSESLISYNSELIVMFDLLYFWVLWHIIRWTDWYNNVCFGIFIMTRPKNSAEDFLPLIIFKLHFMGMMQVNIVILVNTWEFEP